ncbi:quinoprotein dehydrogenase-associated SoxYZ-like carrier [Zestomonas thermotolerans]|uniref:quinoprotein dehydrogenase-associated SoxYZ-like carrier n=1 Tax=Zestomonas thermotolerans TaxID=157784 RepID=UPI0003A665AF|nr:quinoprotein dehydrogenase-associated SoxYZ-like carrier [Pseudomonas thermotolerans]MBO2509328.1 quinoprotein dehydrogenase-associated SoxYZ-like carrier [Gammaproteobacteria bacterium]
MRRTLLGLLFLPCLVLAATSEDPLKSSMWDFHRQRLLGTEPVLFDERVLLEVPPFAEDARQVPIRVDASALAGQVVRMVAWAELNPIPHIFTFHPHSPQVRPMLAIRIRVEQATALRAAVLTRDGVWHVGSARIEAAGGGCTAPSVVRSEPGWEQRLGQVHGARFPRGEVSRLRLRVDHPMDNGLTAGIPEFFLNQAELRDASGKALATLELFPAVAENPTIGLEVGGQEATRLWLRDNNGNEFEANL